MFRARSISMSTESWTRSLAHLRGARSRWHGAVVARTSVHDLLFTLPGDDGYPFAQSVAVTARDGGAFEVSWDGGRLQEKRLTDVEHVDGLLDLFLERLTSPVNTCTACGGQVLVSSTWFETFERMHWTCFHYEFEHEPFDRDEECIGGGCPSAAVDPWHVLNDPRDALVAQLLDDLRTGDLATGSLVAQVEREGPGVISARFDENLYRLTVRRIPERRTGHRESSDRE
jgi:hypothetical protein